MSRRLVSDQAKVACDGIATTTSIAQVQRLVKRTLGSFEAGEFGGVEPIPCYKRRATAQD